MRAAVLSGCDPIFRQDEMLTSLIGQTVEDLDTPALLVDLEALDGNIAFMATYLRDRGVAWRPHAKAHKSPAIAHREIAAGAIGITCAKLGEAEVYVASGIRDILIANQIVGPIKTRRLAALAREAEIMVAVDHIDQVIAIDAAARESGSRPRVVLEVDSGMNRAGVAPGAAALELARRVSALDHLRFEGLMTWEGHAMAIADPEARVNEIRNAIGRVTETVEAIRTDGIPVNIVSSGGTGTFLTTGELSGITEVQAGGGIFGDAVYRGLGVPVQPALSIMVTVTSRPTPERILIDAGRKTIDPSAHAPVVADLEHVASVVLSAEHGNITLSQPSATPRIGDRLRMLVGYSDQAVHLHEQHVALCEDRVVAIWPTLARGRLQ
jgi:D-serine deaminase-like pyridoxal phosphate-dependent protein